MTTPSYQLVDAGVFAAVRQVLIARTGKGLTEEDVRLINFALALDDPKPAPMLGNLVSARLTLQTVLELFSHEAVIQEMYLDSVKVETWSAGLTAKSGINVKQYKDNPQPMQVCIRAVIDRLTRVYVPNVITAFGSKTLTEAQFAAALSFEFNTGAVLRADWVKSVIAGRTAQAHKEIMNWRSPPEIIGRREKERDLFFDGRWTNDGTTTVIGVRKPSYQPDWRSAKKVNIQADLKAVLGI